MSCFAPFNLSFDHVVKNYEGLYVVGVFSGIQPTDSFKELDEKCAGFLTKSIKNSSFTGKSKTSISIFAEIQGKIIQVLCIGLGDKNCKNSNLCYSKLGASIWHLIKTRNKVVTIDFRDSTIEAKSISHIAEGIKMKAFEVDCYKTKKDESSIIKNLIVIGADTNYFEKLNAVIEGNILTRRVVMDPPNVLYPETMALKAKSLVDNGVSVEILGEAELRALGMNAMVGVGQGSAFESKLIVLELGPKDKQPIVLVGKGVTFDTGGISIKPADKMDEMKGDMAGAAAILGLFNALAIKKTDVHVVGILGMVENMPSGTAQRPGDIVKSMSGQTIEILNTDAEGRLVLADALWYAQDRFKPKCMIDLATLTGAIRIALGHEFAGLFSNDDELANGLIEAGKEVGEDLWRMPLHENYDKEIDSDIADVKNIGSGRGAGSSTAAHFLKRFTNNVPWAHLDIACVAYDNKPTSLTPKGATGFGVRLLDNWIEKLK